MEAGGLKPKMKGEDTQDMQKPGAGVSGFRACWQNRSPPDCPVYFSDTLLVWVDMDAIPYFSIHLLTPRNPLQHQAATNRFKDIFAGYIWVFGFQPVHQHSNFRFIKQSLHIFRFFLLPAPGKFNVPLKTLLF